MRASNAALASSASLQEERLELARLLEEREKRAKRNQLKGFRPHPKQLEYFAAGAKIDGDGNERLLMAGNQLGKSKAGGMEWAIHLSGRYPDWWPGAEFKKPVLFWAASESGLSTRDTVQTQLVGPAELEEEWGTGAIPFDALTDWDRASGGVANLLDNVQVRWGGGGDTQAGTSICYFKTYEQGRRKWQGPTRDGVWFDEEPDEDIYGEGRTRTQRGQRGVFVQLTFTPLLGMSKVVTQFLGQADVDVMTKGAA